MTGTNRGLGQYFARALAKAGADLVLTARNRESLASFAAKIESLGRRAVPLELDVQNQEISSVWLPRPRPPSGRSIF